MQISKFYTYYLKKLFKNIWFWVGAIILNVASFWQRWEVHKIDARYNPTGTQNFWGWKINYKTIASGDWKAFWGWTLSLMFIYFFFWLVFGMSSTIGNSVGNLVSEPKENGEDGFFLSYTSPTKRSDVVWAKMLAGFTFFMVANLIYSLSALFWWIKYSQTSLDYLYIFLQIFVVPVLFFCLLTIPLFYFASNFSGKAVRTMINYVIPILSLLLGGLAAFLVSRALVRLEKGTEEAFKVIWDALKLFDYAALIVLAFALFSLLIGFTFFYLYKKRFQEKDIT